MLASQTVLAAGTTGSPVGVPPTQLTWAPPAPTETMALWQLKPEDGQVGNANWRDVPLNMRFAVKRTVARVKALGIKTCRLMFSLGLGEFSGFRSWGRKLFACQPFKYWLSS